MAKLIAPSLLSADFANLQDDIEMINRSDADWFHLDIMDGVFVPNISFGFPVIEKIAIHTKKPLDAHLMIIDPDRYFERFKDLGINILSIHIETCNHLHRSVESIKKLGMKAGVVLNPHTSPLLVEDIINDVDLVLIMSVNPGFGGQKFIPHTYQKISRVREMIQKRGSNAMIEVDGGVDQKNAKLLFDAGANILVAGNAIFKANDPLKMIKTLKTI